MYDQLKNTRTDDGTIHTNDGAEVYAEVKKRLMRFQRTLEEKQAAALQDWAALSRGGLSALQFETPWEVVPSKLIKLGLGRGSKELLLGYYSKIGAKFAAEIKKDRRD
jgi:hypothetical protein